MAEKSLEMAVEAMASMEMAPRALPHPGRVPEQRLLSPEIHRWRQRSCRTLSRKLSILFGFSIRRLYIGGEAASEGDQGAHTIGWCTLGVTHTAQGYGRPLAPLRLSFSLRLAFGKNRRFGFFCPILRIFTV
jgi:hypothetical protein